MTAAMLRRLPLLFSMLVLAILPASGRDPRPLLGAEARMRATPVALDPDDPARRSAGALTYLGGVRLTSPDSAFGGFSSMLVSGDRFTLLSDGGNIVQFRMGADWQPREAIFADLREGPRTGWAKSERDTESMTHDPATGRVWIGFEGSNAIWRYDPRLAHAERHAEPAAMRDWDFNGGPEAMVRQARGSFVILSETTRPPGGRGRVGLRFSGDPTDPASRGFAFAYLPPPGYDPSDMTELPDGRLLVLNRRVSLSEFFTAKLTLIDAAAIRPGAVVGGPVVATLAAPLLHDNFEALAATREGAATILWIATDDNLAFFEQSLLLKFRLDLPAKP